MKLNVQLLNKRGEFYRGKAGVLIVRSENTILTLAAGSLESLPKLRSGRCSFYNFDAGIVKAGASEGIAANLLPLCGGSGFGSICGLF